MGTGEGVGTGATARIVALPPRNAKYNITIIETVNNASEITTAQRKVEGFPEGPAVGFSIVDSLGGRSDLKRRVTAVLFFFTYIEET